ncbi:methyltransferase [soil metagenome]
MLLSALPDTGPLPPPPAGMTVPPSLTENGFLGGRLRILQPEKGYRAGIDAVFLASSIPASSGETIFEAGMGTGVTALCLVTRVPSCHVTGIEMTSRYALMAEENVRRNNFNDSVRVIHGDVRDALRRDLSHMPAQGSFSHAFANPPYYDTDKTTSSPTLLKSIAHQYGPEDLDLWVKVMHTMVAPRGSATIIHRADCLGKLLAVMDARFGDLRIAPLYAREGLPASRIIIQGIKGSKAPMQLLPGLVLHQEDSKYTPGAELILRDAHALRLR